MHTQVYRASRHYEILDTALSFDRPQRSPKVSNPGTEHLQEMSLWIWVNVRLNF